MRKVAVLLPDLTVAGGQKMALGITENLVNCEEVQIRIICLGKDGGSAFDIEVRQKNLDVVYLNKGQGLALGTIPKLVRTLKEFDPDVIHCHLPRMHYYLPAMLLSKAKIRYYTVHNLAEKDYEFPLERFLIHVAIKFFRIRPVAISELCKASITEVYGVKPEKIPCIYNGIDTKRFARKAPYQTGEKFNFLAVGRLSDQKNYPLMLRAFARVHKRYPNTKLTVLGDGENRAALETLQTELNLQSAVDFAGVVANVENYMWSAQSFLMSSDYEGLPVVVLEAMAAGMPIISTKAGGVIDVVENEGNGLLVDCNNEDALVEAMERLINEQETCFAFANRSRELAQKYSIQACAEQHKELYMV